MCDFLTSTLPHFHTSQITPNNSIKQLSPSFTLHYSFSHFVYLFFLYCKCFSGSQCYSESFHFFHIAFNFHLYEPELLLVSSEEPKAPMSFFGFDPQGPPNRGHPAQAPGFGSAPDPFASISQGQGLGQEEDDAYVDCLPSKCVA